MTTDQILQMQQVMRECGDVILHADRTQAGVQSKSASNDLVTKYDKAVQEMLQKRLLEIIPNAHFMGEEEDEHDNVTKGTAFIVDPIDGTANFVKDYRCSVISVAVAQEGEMVLGLIYNPYTDEMFSAEKGKGAYCNGEPIHVSERPLKQGLTIFGSASYYKELHDRSFLLLRRAFDRSMDIRRSGSAAFDLCTIAAGRAELFFELRLWPWDYAAGMLLVREAGGTVTRVEGGEPSLTEPSSVLACGSCVDASFLTD